MYQSWNICIESQTISITCKLRIPTCYLENMLGILCRSWIQFNNIFKRRYHQHNIEAGVLSHSITTIQGCPNRFGIAELQITFIKFCRMRKCECTYANPLLFFPKIYENWMLFMILKSMYLWLFLSKGGEWEIAVRPIQGFYQCHMMPIECTTEPSTMISLDLTHKLCIDTKKYCFVISCVLIPGQVISIKGKTVDKDRTKASNGFKTFTEVRLCKIKMENHATFTLLENCKRYFQVHFDPSINGCAGNISNTM